MKRSQERILSTHVGSLPRPDRMLEFLERREAGGEVVEDAFDEPVGEASEAVVRRQDEAGIDVASHGEMGRLAFVLYAAERLTGFDGEVPAVQWADLEEYPEFARRCRRSASGPSRTRPSPRRPAPSGTGARRRPNGR